MTEVVHELRGRARRGATLPALASGLLLALAGCSEPTPPPSDAPLATVGERAISAAQFDAFLVVTGLDDADAGRRARTQAEFLEREALAAAIEASGFLDPILLEAELNEFRKQLLISRYMEAYLGEQVSEEAIRNHYNLHPERYQAEQVRVSHILLRTTDRTGDSELRAILTSAHEIYSQLRGLADFAELAMQRSEDRLSAVKGGDLGWLERGAVHPEFSQRVFAMQAGEISEPFRTPFGFHVVKVVEGPVVTKTPFDAVRGDIRYQLRNEAKRAELDRLRASVEVKQ